MISWVIKNKTMLCETMEDQSAKSKKMSNQNQQQWEFWEYDESSWDCTADDDTTTSGDSHLHHLNLTLEHKPTISNLSSLLAKEEDSRHLFAASMFEHTAQFYDSDASSVDSDGTARICNKGSGQQLSSSNDDTSASKLGDTAKLAASEERATSMPGFIKEDFSLSSDLILSVPSKNLYKARKQHKRRRSWPGEAVTPNNEDWRLFERGIPEAEVGGRARAA